MNGGEDFSVKLTGRGMLLLAAKDFVVSLAAAIFFVVAARFLPVSDLGFLTGIYTLMGMFVIFSGLGLARSATRFIPAFTGSGEPERARPLYPLIFYVSTFSSIVFALILYFLAPTISITFFHGLGYIPLIELASLDVFLVGLSFSSMFLLYASQKFRSVALISILSSVVKFPAALTLLFLGFGLEGIIFGLIIGDAMALIMLTQRLLPYLRVRVKFMSSDFKGLLRYALPLYGSMILNFLINKVDVYMLMILSSLYAVGIYSPAAFLGTTFFVVLSALDQALLPYTSNMFGKSGFASFKNSSRLVCKYLFLFYFPLGFGIIASAPQLIPIFLGDRYIDSIYPTVIIILGITLTSPGIIVNTLLYSAGYSKTLLKADSMGLGTQLAISLALIPSLGTIGAAVAKSVSRIIFFLYPAYYLWKLKGFDYERNHLIVGVFGSSMMGIFIFILGSLVSNSYWLPAVYILGILIYVLVLRRSNLIGKEDLQLIDEVLPSGLEWVTPILGKVLQR